MHEFFDHTADLGLRARAATLGELFAEMATALFAAIVDDLRSVRPELRVDVVVEGTDQAYLLFDWLRELLYRHDAEHMLFSRFEVEETATGVKGCAWGEVIDPARHVLAHEVKAITYHGLRVEREGDGWVAEVIVDI